MNQKIEHKFSSLKSRCVLMGDEDEVQMMKSFLAEYPRLEIVYIYDGYCMGATKLSSIISSQQVHEIILGNTRDLDQETKDVLVRCREQGVTITTFPLFYENLTGRIPVHSIGEQGWPPLFFGGTRDKGMYVVSKRLLDIGGAALGLVLFGLLFPFIVLGIKLDSPGPIFYRQARIGKNGKTFVMRKLRTMVVDAEKEGKALWARENDPRVTRVGRWLRKTRLDEAPQYWKILKGEMSIVGPRPERPEFDEMLEKKIPFYSLRYSVKPGLAGWAMVSHGYAASMEDAKIRLEYDLYYIKYRSFWFDVVIFFRAFWHLVTMKGV